LIEMEKIMASIKIDGTEEESKVEEKKKEE
jgi:hypothetical protein